MATTLTIDGNVINPASAGLRYRTLRRRLEGHDVFEFDVIAGAMSPSYNLGDAVLVDVKIGEDTVRQFRGALTSVSSQHGPRGWTHSYQARGLAYLADLIPVTNAARGNNRYAFNLRSDDPDYLAQHAGLTVGAMVTVILEDHYTELDALDLGTWDAGDLDGTIVTDLAALDWTPPEPVFLSGERLWSLVGSLLDQWAPNHALAILPDGTFRCWDVTNPPSSITLTLGDDLIDPPSLVRDLTDSFTAVILRGDARIEAAWLSYFYDETLTAEWSADDQDDWKWSDFAAPQSARVAGTVTANTSTTVTVDPDDNAVWWDANFWGPSTAKGEVIVWRASGTGYATSYEVRPIASNTSLTAGAGNTSVLTVGFDFVGDDFERFEINGRNTGLSGVWRKFRVADADMRAALAPRFPRPMPFSFANGVSLVEYPQGVITWTEGSLVRQVNVAVEVDPVDGYVWYQDPVCKWNNDTATLEAGGADVVAPDEIAVFLPFRAGTLEARYPAADYEGPAFDLYGLERLKVVDLPEWTHPGAQAQMDALAEELHRVVSAVVIETDLIYHGQLDSALTFFKGVVLEGIVGPGGGSITTGLADLVLPIRGVTLSWPGDGPDTLVTTLHLSTRRRAMPDRLWTAAAHYTESKPDTRFLGQGDSLVLGGPGTHAALPSLPLQRPGISLADQAAFGQRMAGAVTEGQAHRGGDSSIDWSQYQSRHAQTMQSQAREAGLVDARRQATLSEYAPGFQGPTLRQQAHTQYAGQQADKAWLQRLDVTAADWNQHLEQLDDERRRKALARRYSTAIDTTQLMGGGG